MTLFDQISGGVYKMGWLLVAYDLPVAEKEDRKHATKFHSDVLELGFQMWQYSLYVKPCANHASLETAIRGLRRVAPSKGLAHVLFVTDLQWKQSEVLVGKPPPEAPAQAEFWDLLGDGTTVK